MPARRDPVAVLTAAQLNRATLDRQLLLRRRRLGVAQALTRLVGLQAQATDPPFLGLLARLDDYHPEQLSRALLRRRAVRTTLLRGTVRVVTTDDALWLRPTVQPVLDRGFRANALSAQLDGVAVADVAAHAARLLDARVLTTAQLREELGRAFARPPAALAHAAWAMVPTARVGPRNLWRGTGQVQHTGLESWVGRPLVGGDHRDELVLRYLRGYGPATVADMQKWSGLQGLRDVVDRLGERLVPLTDERGRHLWDVAGARRPPARTQAPVRLLPDFDDVLIGFDDRTRVISPEALGEVFTVNGIVRPTVLVDGRVAGTWSVERDGVRARLVVSPFDPLPPSVTEGLRGEATRVLAVREPDADRCEVTVGCQR
ncbi:winged helix DNA-binding domain-containing protein [Thalassiella azotivora]